MAKIRLSTEMQRVIAAARFRADKPAREIAKLARVKAHNVHYYLSKLLNEGVISRRVLINQFALGCENFQLLLSITPKRRGSSEQFIRLLQKHPQVIWCGMMNGEYQYGITLLGRNSSSVLHFLDEITDKQDFSIIHKSFGSILSFTLLAKKYLWPEARHLPDSLELKAPSKVVEIDELDSKILSEINKLPSNTELAGSLGIPRSTVDLRVRKMHDRGIISGSVLYISAEQLGLQTYRLLLFSRGHTGTFIQKACACAKKMLQAVSFRHVLGPWEAEIVVEVFSPEEVVQLVETLNEALAPLIAEIKVLQIVRQYATNNFVVPS